MVDRELNLNHLGGSYGGGINPFFVLDLQQRVDDTKPLEKDFVPTSWSVICGRTKKSEDHGKFIPGYRIDQTHNAIE